MKDIVIVGAQGIAVGVSWIIEEINRKNNEWNILGFIDDNEDLLNKELNGYRVIGNTEKLKSMDKDIYIIIAIGDGNIRKKIVNKLGDKKYATIIHPDVKFSKKLTKIGEGTIIWPGTIFNVFCNIGKHVYVNMNCTIGHDVTLRDYVTVLPASNISGNVLVKEKSSLGTNSCIIQGLEIGENVILGAGSVVVKNIEDNCVVVGNPAKKIKDKD
ncbi:MAG: acetyltransferase [Fusobacterium sp.]